MRLYTITIFLLLFVTVASAQEIVSLRPYKGITDVGIHSLSFLDEHSQYTAQDIASGRCDSLFHHQQRELIDYSITKGAAGCRFRVANTNSEKAYLSVIFPNHDSVSGTSGPLFPPSPCYPAIPTHFLSGNLTYRGSLQKYHRK